MSISVAVPTVPQRRHLVVPLIRNHLPKNTMISVDDSGLWVNARKCWIATIEKGTDYCMVIQDDVKPVQNFMVNVWRMIEQKPKDILSLFCSRMRDMQEAWEAKASWIEYDTICWGQCVVMPRAIAIQFLQWADAETDDRWIMDDGRVALFAALRGEKIYSPFPTPLQHSKELRSTWADRDGTTLQSHFVGKWEKGKTIRPVSQRSVKTLIETKGKRWLKTYPPIVTPLEQNP